MNKYIIVLFLGVFVVGYYIGQYLTKDDASMAPELTIDTSTCIKAEQGYKCEGEISGVTEEWLDTAAGQRTKEIHRIRV